MPIFVESYDDIQSRLDQINGKATASALTLADCESALKVAQIKIDKVPKTYRAGTCVTVFSRHGFIAKSYKWKANIKSAEFRLTKEGTWSLVSLWSASLSVCGRQLPRATVQWSKSAKIWLKNQAEKAYQEALERAESTEIY